MVVFWALLLAEGLLALGETGLVETCYVGELEGHCETWWLGVRLLGWDDGVEEDEELGTVLNVMNSGI